MPVPSQPEKGVRRKYQARYRLSVGKAAGWDDSLDVSMPPEEALAVARNVRIHDGIIVSRGGQTLASDGMDGAIVGMIETDDRSLEATTVPACGAISWQPNNTDIYAAAYYADPSLPYGFDNPPMSLTLDPGDGGVHAGVGSPPSISHPPPSAGTLLAKASATSTIGTGTSALCYTYFGGPTGTEYASFTQLSFGDDPTVVGYASKAAPGTTVDFDFRASAGIITGWDIDLGDGSAHVTGSGAGWLAAAQFSHAYAAGGTYTITTRLSSAYGIVQATASITVTAGVALVALVSPWYVNFAGAGQWWNLPAAGRTVTFTFHLALASTVDEWDFDYGDGSPHVIGAGTVADFYAALNYLPHTYAADGTYLAVLHLKTGGVTVSTRHSHVVVSAGQRATGNFVWCGYTYAWNGPTSERQLLYMFAIPVKDVVGLTWDIDFGDGSPHVTGAGTMADYYTAARGQHVYAADGTYALTAALTSASYNITMTGSVTVAIFGLGYGRLCY